MVIELLMYLEETTTGSSSEANTTYALGRRLAIHLCGLLLNNSSTERREKLQEAS
jgi:hypothetical protein